MFENSGTPPLPRNAQSRPPGLYIVLPAFMLFCLAGGTALVWMAFGTQHSFAGRLPAFTMAAVVLFFPAMFVFTSARRKLTKGHWLPNEADITMQREEDFRRAQSPMTRRLIATLQILAGILLAVVWGFTDIHVIQHHSLKSWWTLYIAVLQLALFWAYWRACRVKQSSPRLPGKF